MRVRRGVALLAVVGILLAVEAFARLVLGLGNPPLSVAHPTIEYMFRPDQDVERFGHRVLINHYGMRSDPFPAHKADNEIRVMAFGDSVPNGGNLTNQEDLATTLLQQRLKQRLHQTVIVGNISAGSWGPGNWLAYAETYGFFHADAVILVISSHDAADNPTFAPLDPHTHPQRKPVSALLEGITRYLPRYLPRLTQRPSAVAAPVGDVVDSAAMQRGLADLRKFLQLALAQTPNVSVFQHAERGEIETGQFKPGHAEIARLGAELGVPVIQLAPAFRSAMSRGEEPYRDNIHPNELGQRLMEEVLEKELAAQWP